MEPSNSNQAQNNQLCLDQYSKYFSPCLSAYHHSQLRQRLRAANVHIVDESLDTANSQGRPPALALQSVSVRPVSVEARGALITYRVEIGPLVLHIQMLNLSENAPSKNRQLIHEKRSGSTKVTLGRSVEGREFICKSVYFKSKTKALRIHEDGDSWEVSGRYFDVETVIAEYSIAKVCFILGVGVPVGSPDHQFDLICYEDCI